jgi:hypothetical protein
MTLMKISALFLILLFSACKKEDKIQPHDVDSLKHIIDSLQSSAVPHPYPAPSAPTQSNPETKNDTAKKYWSNELDFINHVTTSTDIKNWKSQWKQFRNNEKQYKGTQVSWELKITAFHAVIDNDFDYPCILYNTANVDKNSTSSHQIVAGVKGAPSIHTNDLVRITGIFTGISENGELYIKCSQVIDKGVE